MSFLEINKRFKATRDGTNMVTILTQIKNADAESSAGIKMVDKRNGTEVANLILDNKKPEYVLDDIGRTVYYTATPISSRTVGLTGKTALMRSAHNARSCFVARCLTVFGRLLQLPKAVSRFVDMRSANV